MHGHNTGDFEFPLRSILLREQSQKEQGSNLKEADIRSRLNETTAKLNNANGILELLPDLEKAMEVRTGAILSPKTLMFQGLHLRTKKGVAIDAVKVGKALSILEEHIRTFTDMEDDIPRYINEALFKYGANIILMIPPNSLDTLISGSEFSGESISDYNDYFTNLNIISHSDNFVEIVDNLNLLRRSNLTDAINRNKNTELGMESYGNAPVFKHRPLQKLFTGTMDTRIGAEPIIYDIPLDACLHIYEPSKPSNHIAYFIPIDEHGSIISEATDSAHFEELADRLDKMLQSKSGADYEAMKALGFVDKIKETRSNEDFVKLYESTMDETIRNAVQSQGASDHIKVKGHDSFYRMMLKRHLSKQKTKLLYVPAELVDYMAFDYDNRGYGRSLLEKTQLYSSLRAVVMFSDLLRQMDNSIPRQKLNVTLDEDDTTPYETLQTMLHEYGRLSDRALPLGTFSPMSLLDQLRKSGIQLNVDGGSKWPGTKLEREDIQRSVSPIDDTLTELLKKSQYAGLSVPPEAIDMSLQGSFAINTLTENQLFMKQSMLDQFKFRRLLKNRITKYVYVSGPLYEKLTKELEDITIEEFLRCFEVYLPTADMVRIEQHQLAFTAYSEFVDEVVAQFIGEDIMDGLVEAEDLDGKLEELRGNIAAHYKREYILRENILPEIHGLIDGEDDYVVKSIIDYNGNILHTVSDILKGIIKDDNKINDKLIRIREKLEAGDEEIPTDDNPVSNSELEPDEEGTGETPDDDFNF